MKLNRLHLLLLAAAAVGVTLFLVLGTSSAKTNNLLTCETAPVLLERIETRHISGQKRDAAMIERVADTLLERWDSTRALMTKAEAEAVRQQVRSLFAQLERGECPVVTTLRTEQLARHEAMRDYVGKRIADPGFKLDKSLVVEMDPDKRKRGDKAQRDALREGMIQFQIANFLHAKTTLEEAKTKLNKRYELITKRIAEQDDADILAGILQAYAYALDPHSTYFSPDDLEDFRISMGLSLEGIGALLRQRDGITTVAEIVKGGAADRQGELEPEDKILAVSQGENGEPVDVIDMSIRDVVRLIRGKKGTKVKLSVLRKGEKTRTFSVVITRDKIKLEDQAAKLRWETVVKDGRSLKLAVLTLPSFYGSSQPNGRSAARDVAKLLTEAEAGGADGLLFDLASNSGGILSHAVDIGGFFLKTGGIVRVEGEGRGQTLEDEDPRVFYTGPVVVLTSRLSASASEIVAGAIKDYNRGVIVGDDTTFGKGTVQNVDNLPPGLGAIKVTTAMFYRPSGVSTQKKGVPADIVVPSPFNSDRFGEGSNDNALPSTTTRPFRSASVNGGPNAWTPVTDAQVATLKKQSAARVAASEDFKKIRENLAKAEERVTTMTIAEILDGKDGDEDGDEKKADDDAETKKDDDDELSPQAKEALAVLTDLVNLQGTGTAMRRP